MSVVEWGEWLVARVDEHDTMLATWLDQLAGFDDAAGWAVDGQVSCVDWLMWKARMSRSTAYERLQVAHALEERPRLREAFHAGRVSYSAIRVMARLERPGPDVDEALIVVAQTGTVRDVERMVAAYRRHADQDCAPDDDPLRRGVRTRHNFDGTTTIEITLDPVEAADFLAVLDAFMADAAGERLDTDGREAEPGSAGPSACADHDSTSAVAGAAKESAGSSARADDRRLWGPRRADAVVEMCRTALRHLGDGKACGADRFMVHILANGAGMTLLDGTVLDEATAQRIVEDSSATTLLLGPGYEPLAMGRKTREWTIHQRRALRIRDGGQCRFPGCRRHRWLHAHHHQWWRDGGPTNVSNGHLECIHHHRLIHHEGFEVTGQPNGELTFHRPDGSVLGSTTSRVPV